jgi:hypothetical protein
LYEKTGDVVDLLNLVNFLDEQQAWQDLVPMAEALFDKTRSTTDAHRVARVYGNAGEHKRLLEFLTTNNAIVGREAELQAILAWTLYRDGQFKAAGSALAALRARRDDGNDRALFVNLTIATGQWDSLVGYTTNEWLQREHRTAQDLLGAGQLAQAVGAPHARELIIAATERASEDPSILATAYLYACSGGWENEGVAGDWLLKAAAESGDQGPLKPVSIKELFELKPDWDRRSGEIYAALDEGRITVSAAALGLNESMIHFGLLRPYANRLEPDVRRRNIVHAFSGARPASSDIDPRRIALDLTTIFTLSQLNLLDRVTDHYERILIPDQLLVWLFQERQRVSFHQPSRLKDAHFLKRLLDDGLLKIFTAQRPAAPLLVREVGYDLAAMLEAAQQSTSPAYVIRSSPVSRVGSLMEEEADLTSHKPRLCSCQAVVDALRLKGIITAAEENRALSYLKLHEARWPEEPRIRDGATLYLDDLSTAYLRTIGVLDKLKAAGFKAFVTKSLNNHDNQLITYESASEKQLSTIETIRSVLAKGLAGGRIEAIASPQNSDDDNQLKTRLNFLATDKALDAFVVDDRFVNRYQTMAHGSTQTPIITSLDLIGHLVSSGAISVDDGYEHRTNLRRSGYAFVPVTEQELVHHLLNAPLIDGALVERAELRAIRESVLKVRLSKLLQVPHELAWLQQLNIAVLHAARIVWTLCADAKDAAARCEWLIPHFDTRGWASIVQEGAAALFARSSYAGVLHALAFAPDIVHRAETSPYHRWVEERLLREIAETEPEVYSEIVAIATGILNRTMANRVEQAFDEG